MQWLYQLYFHYIEIHLIQEPMSFLVNLLPYAKDITIDRDACKSRIHVAQPYLPSRIRAWDCCSNFNICHFWPWTAVSKKAA